MSGVDIERGLNKPETVENAEGMTENELEDVTKIPDWFELVQAPILQGLGRLSRQVWIHLKPADRVSLLYLLLTLPLCFVAKDMASMLWGAVFMRIVVVFAVIYLRSFCKYTTANYNGKSTWFAQKIDILGFHFHLKVGPIEIIYAALDWYVAVLFGYLYSETGLLITNIHGFKTYDREVQKYEEELFTFQPSKDLRQWYPVLNSKMLGEYLHFCYFMYYLIIVSVAAVLYLTRPREFYDRCVTAVALGFYTCFGFYLLFPVQGPYWSFERADPTQISYFFCYVVRFVLSGGSSKGTAMPSGHCAISIICWIVALRYHKPLAIIYTFFVPGLVFATVWCGFHYGLDAGIGTIWGITCGIAGIWLAKTVPYVQPYHDKANYGAALMMKEKYRPAKTI
eukprot:TRINITY_DN16406_c0_g1_i1.p1 TRINITY_DN16406_c0_g1~~TRINITY_DN16406_c0_g1_i1.p1  ORF type:complete len:396 (-),score=41.57 TRINITY_DN16406_c0_g1_i1:166-1353(-)